MQTVPELGDGALIIDGHVHAFPTEFISARQSLLAAEPWFRLLYEHESARLVDEIALILSMDASGIDRAVMCGFPWTDLGRCRAHNDWLASVSQASDGRLAWLGIVPPHHPDAAIESERALAMGAVGIGELNADGQGFDLLGPNDLCDVMAVCQAASRVVLIHASEPVGHRYPGKGAATPDRLLSFITDFPENDIVLAHWGGGLPFYELMPEVAVACQRVTYDTAASTYLYRPAVFETVVNLVGADRVLWGSDFPILGQDRFLRAVRSRNLSDAQTAKILRGTAERVYRLRQRTPRDPALNGEGQA